MTTTPRRAMEADVLPLHQGGLWRQTCYHYTKEGYGGGRFTTTPRRTMEADVLPLHQGGLWRRTFYYYTKEGYGGGRVTTTPRRQQQLEKASDDERKIIPGLTL